MITKNHILKTWLDHDRSNDMEYKKKHLLSQHEKNPKDVSKYQLLTQNTTAEVSDGRFLIILHRGASAGIVVSHGNDSLRTYFTPLTS